MQIFPYPDLQKGQEYSNLDQIVKTLSFIPNCVIDEPAL